MNKTYILNKQQIALKLERMALEIAERNTDATRIILAGIVHNGVLMTGVIRETLAQYFSGTIEEIQVSMDKRHPVEVTLDRVPSFDHAVVVLVDDVANSGKTLTYAIKPFLDHFPDKIQTCVLVDRTHKKFPIQPDYVGFSLATTIQEYIDVEVEDGLLSGAWVA
ncbi:MAG: phosphoribosyltransferase [Chitinophagaceae bacterium]|nr:phosphoribosyltransferase [Chitinophagaceae bacterium]